MSSDPSVIRIKPYHYIHVLDNNTNIPRVETGPKTYTRQDHEKIIEGPAQMIMIPPRHYCVIANPVVRKADKSIAHDANGNIKLSHGDEEIRPEQEPFPLYPGEKLVGKVTALQVVGPDAALRLRSIRDFEGKVAGDEWLFKGPGTYQPRIEVQVVESIKAIIIKPNTALKLRARKACTDTSGKPRDAGEEWLVRSIGAYLPGVDEEIVDTLKARILTDKTALHIKANKTFTDVFGKKRKAGEEWLVTLKEAETYIPDVYEELVGEVKITTLTNRQYCVVLDPVISGHQHYGKKVLRKGPDSFFLQPGERLEQGIQAVIVLGAEEALLLRAREVCTDGKEKHLPGERWMIHGPCDYVPPVEVEVIERRSAIALDENEGIYIRELTTGKVRQHIGESYMLKAKEELWAKELSDEVEELLMRARTASDSRSHTAAPASKTTGPARDKTKVVVYRAPHGSVVQIYDYKEKKARVAFGPDLIMLGPDEQFTVVSLSGDTPKRPDVIKSLSLLLGPDFMTDVVIVETSDHARLSLKLAYNWYFEVNRDSQEDGHKVFSVPDFVGDACKAIASRVRGTVAAVSFDKFHRNSSDIIVGAVFGVDPETNQPKNKFLFKNNGLVITNIDIHSVEPVDQRTRDSLTKSVQLAIEITTKSQEATARHEAERIEQEAKGRLERQKIQDEGEAEKARKHLLQLQAQSAAVEATGQATAEAKARAEAANIEGQAAVKQAQLTAESRTIRASAELEQLTKRQEQEITHTKATINLEVLKARELAAIEAKKFKDIVDAIGADTIKKIAQAGPEMQAKLLGGLGLKSLMITDGSSPINLFNTAAGLVSTPSK